MAEPDSDLPKIYLSPGEIALAQQPTILATILGSCIGITFWCARLGAGALCHSILPRIPQPPVDNMYSSIGYRYVDYCVRSLASQFDRLGAARTEVEVKVFGGADLISVDQAETRPSVGKLNSKAAAQTLADEGFAVVASSVGGTFGRKICFNTGSGEVRLVRLI
jgi:chemotaxis protein CheD